MVLAMCERGAFFVRKSFFPLLTVVIVFLLYFAYQAKFQRHAEVPERLLSTEINDCLNPDFENELMAIFSREFGYTLIGAKPVSVEDVSEFLSKDIKTKEAFFLYLEKVFFKSGKFILRIFRSLNYLELIDTASLSEQISKNRKFRNFVYKKYQSKDKFFDILRNSDMDIFAALNHNPILVGIALGYGEENAKFFLRRCDIAEYLQKYPIISVFPFDQPPGHFQVAPIARFVNPDRIHVPTALPQFQSLEQEWESILKSERKGPETETSPPYYIAIPSYVSKYGTESDAIHAGFFSARDKLARLFCAKKPSQAIVGELNDNKIKKNNRERAAGKKLLRQ